MLPRFLYRDENRLKKSSKLIELAQRIKAKNEGREAENATTRSQLNMEVDSELKEALRDAYGRNLTRIFEEEMLARLMRDGYVTVITKEDGRKNK